MSLDQDKPYPFVVKKSSREANREAERLRKVYDYVEVQKLTKDEQKLLDGKFAIYYGFEIKEELIKEHVERGSDASPVLYLNNNGEEVKI